jgi:hypothetical protein
MSGSIRKRQKKLENSRKKRELLKKEARKREAQFQGASLLRLAQSAPFGPAWISASLDEPDAEQMPALVTVIVTRRVRGLWLAEIVLVDRTCLGVKNAMLLPPLTEVDLLDRVDALASAGNAFRPCEPLEAQSVVFHAIDYARSLGFCWHEDFEIALFEPRPESLLATPLATPARPIYISGPHDDVDLILERLNERVGPGNFEFLAGNGGLGGNFDDEDEEPDVDALDTAGESAEDWQE